MNIFEYVRLSEAAKSEILKSSALFIESYVDEDSIISVYYLNGFFVEVTEKNGKITGNLPYSRGYNIKKSDLHAIEKRNTILDLAA